MKIDGTMKAYGPTQTQSSRAPAAPAGKDSAVTGAAEVSLSPLAALMGKAESALANTSEINQQRVDEIRQAISDGQFKINPGRIADGLIASVREMLHNQEPN
ncbi:MAG: flagellar biosynthesis anti-sigma factor FlgM [Thauera sp.]|jgi:negative regulator of flagellin synthesis FlgM|nr:flagellar biosynthesis anti-sigma factor FlgM [Thauera sp.]